MAKTKKKSKPSKKSLETRELRTDLFRKKERDLREQKEELRMRKKEITKQVKKLRKERKMIKKTLKRLKTTNNNTGAAVPGVEQLSVVPPSNLGFP